jgi:hypothetical protein
VIGPVEEMRTLVGRRVVVTLNERDDPPVTVTGVLVDIEDDGGFTLDTPDGRRYGWPALDVTEVTP